MIDDLIDSLVVDTPQPSSTIQSELAELCRGAEDLAPILLAFRNKEWVRVGTRDILGREPTSVVTRELADVAEAIVAQVARDQWNKRLERYGKPRRKDSGKIASWAIVGLGKIGGREMNYLSDLDLLFLYDGDGTTDGPANSTPNERFYTDLAQRVIRALSNPDAFLYNVDNRLRPFGTSGPLTFSLETFVNYYTSQASLWERVAMTHARVLYAQGPFRHAVHAALGLIRTLTVNPNELADEFVTLRKKQRETRTVTPQNLKRRPGGLLDIEYIVRFLSMSNQIRSPELVCPNTWEALDRLHRLEIINDTDFETLVSAYDFYRSLEGRMRLVQNRTDVSLPESTQDLVRLALADKTTVEDKRLPSSTIAENLKSRVEQHATNVLQLFERVVQANSDSETTS